MTKALVLGSTGMLGSAVTEELMRHSIQVLEASRTKGVRFDAAELMVEKLLDEAQLRPSDYIVNCVGLTKSRIDESDPGSRANAVRLNFDFPNSLAKAAETRGIRVLQVATDCVYSGEKGSYLESHLHDPHDVYGKTKSLGEIPAANVMHLRCSLIGPELGRSSLFFEWVRQQPLDAKVAGYTNHHWNGLTSSAFGQVIAGIIKQNGFRAGVQHLVPEDKVTKDELVRMVLSNLKRDDVSVESTEASYFVDRTVATQRPEVNKALFENAGYSCLPTIGQMVQEMCSKLAN